MSSLFNVYEHISYMVSHPNYKSVRVANKKAYTHLHNHAKSPNRRLMESHPLTCLKKSSVWGLFLVVRQGVPTISQ